MVNIEEPAQKKLKSINIESIPLSTEHLKNVSDISNLNTETIDACYQESSYLKSKASNDIESQVSYFESEKHAKLSCLECNMTYGTKSGLGIHMQSIHKGIRYDCSMCDYKANQKSNLVTHKKRHHK